MQMQILHTTSLVKNAKNILHKHENNAKTRTDTHTRNARAAGRKTVKNERKTEKTRRQPVAQIASE